MITSTESSDGGVVIHVTGAFDLDAGQRLGGLLAHAGPDSHVVIDFSRAAIFPDFVVAMLAENIQGTAGRVSLIGVGDHQRRILSYFGVEHMKRAATGSGEP